MTHNETPGYYQTILVHSLRSLMLGDHIRVTYQKSAVDK